MNVWEYRLFETTRITLKVFLLLLSQYHLCSLLSTLGLCVYEDLLDFYANNSNSTTTNVGHWATACRGKGGTVGGV